MRVWAPTLAFGLLALRPASAVPAQQAPLSVLQPALPTNATHPRPLVIWHGLGDTALSSGISSWIEDIQALYPGTYVHSVQIPEGGSLDDERKAGFYGDAVEQARAGCEQLGAIPELQGGFDAVGFSQGGLFLRAYAQFCPAPAPPIRTLVTFGTPHYGIAALLPCPTPPTLTCLLAARAARAGIYRPWAQRNLVQAAYFRDPNRMEEYLDVNMFLKGLSGEGRLDPDQQGDAALVEVMGAPEEGSDEWYALGGRGLSHLENLVAVQFDADRTVSPMQSAHFATYAPGSENKTLVVPLEEQRLWTEDWIGLRGLHDKGGLVFEHCPGEHMDLGAGDCGDRMVKQWLGRPV